MSQAVIGEIIALIMFVATIFVVFIGYPVSFSLAGLALIFAWIGHWFGVFDYALLTGLASRYFGTMINEVLVAVPLFVFMGVVLERSKIAETLLTTMGQMFGGMRGGLGVSVVIVGALLAASTGIVGATVVTMGLLSLPAMMRAGYDPKLAAGVICASGTLGQIIPPSTVLIFIGDLLQGANARAQAEIGNLTPDPISVGELFVGALIPGVSLAVLYALWVLYRAYTDPHAAPPLVMTAQEKAGLGRRIVVALVPPLLLILAVLGSILAGIATPTESASFGAVGALLLTQIKNIAEHFAGTTNEEELEQIMFKFWLVFLAVLIALGFIFGLAGLLIAMTGGFILGTLVTLAIGPCRQAFYEVSRESGRSTMVISSMVFVILLGASVFSLVFRGLGGEKVVEDILEAMPGGQFGAVMLVMVIMFVLGFFLDTFEIIFIMVPITAPVLIKMGVDPLWLGVLMGMNLQTSFLTPPFGFALFYLRGVSEKLISTIQIYRGVLPFVILQVVGIGLMWAVPELATWLPGEVFAVDLDSGPFERKSLEESMPIAPEMDEGLGDMFAPNNN